MMEILPWAGSHDPERYFHTLFSPRGTARRARRQPRTERMKERLRTRPGRALSHFSHTERRVRARAVLCRCRLCPEAEEHRRTPRAPPLALPWHGELRSLSGFSSGAEFGFHTLASAGPCSVGATALTPREFGSQTLVSAVPCSVGFFSETEFGFQTLASGTTGGGELCSWPGTTSPAFPARWMPAGPRPQRGPRGRALPVVPTQEHRSPGRHLTSGYMPHRLTRPCSLHKCRVTD
eukprot:gene17719-biopygen5364